MSATARRLAWALLLIGVCSPAWAGLFDDEEARRRIAEQEVRITELQAQNQTLLERVAKLEEALKNQRLLDLFNRIESFNAEISKLRGEIELLANGLAAGEKRQKDFYVDLDMRLRHIEQPGATANPAPAQEAAATAPAAISAPTASKTPVAAAPPAAAEAGAEGRAYEAAYHQFKLGNYQGAIAGFQGFLKSHPNSALAPNAHYWIGNAYFSLREYPNAIASQNKLVSAYPDSPKVPDALLNIASSQQELNDLPNARKTLESLIARFPISDAAEKAKRRLAALK